MKLTYEQQQAVERFVPLAKKLARGFSRTDDEYESVAYLALCEAVPAFDPTRGGTLMTFLHCCITNRLIDLQRKKSSDRLLTGLNADELPSHEINPEENAMLRELLG